MTLREVRMLPDMSQRANHTGLHDEPEFLTRSYRARQERVNNPMSLGPINMGGHTIFDKNEVSWVQTLSSLHWLNSQVNCITLLLLVMHHRSEEHTSELQS